MQNSIKIKELKMSIIRESLKLACSFISYGCCVLLLFLICGIASKIEMKGRDVDSLEGNYSHLSFWIK